MNMTMNRSACKPADIDALQKTCARFTKGGA